MRTATNNDVGSSSREDLKHSTLPPAFLIGKKDTELLDDEAPATEVTLAGRQIP
jgi:hypothetical protein